MTTRATTDNTDNTGAPRIHRHECVKVCDLPYGRLHDKPGTGEVRFAQPAGRGRIGSSSATLARTEPGSSDPGSSCASLRRVPFMINTEEHVFEYGHRDVSCVVGGGAPTATPGRTNEGCGLPRSGLGRDRIRDEDGPRSVLPERNLPFGRCLDDGTRMTFLAAGERGVERYPDRRGQPLLVRAFRVARREGSG